MSNADLPPNATVQTFDKVQASASLDAVSPTAATSRKPSTNDLYIFEDEPDRDTKVEIASQFWKGWEHEDWGAKEYERYRKTFKSHDILNPFTLMPPSTLLTDLIVAGNDATYKPIIQVRERTELKNQMEKEYRDRAKTVGLKKFGGGMRTKRAMTSV